MGGHRTMGEIETRGERTVRGVWRRQELGCGGKEGKMRRNIRSVPLYVFLLGNFHLLDRYTESFQLLPLSRALHLTSFDL